MTCKPSTPVNSNAKLGNEGDSVAVNKEMYEKLIRIPIYLSHTRGNISFVVSLVSQFMHQSRVAHLQVSIRIVHYLKGIPRRRILLKKNKNVSLEAYTDIDCAGLVVDKRSTTDYCTFHGGNLVTGKSKVW